MSGDTTMVLAELDAAADRFIRISHGRLDHDGARIAALHARPALRERVRAAAPLALRIELADGLYVGLDAGQRPRPDEVLARRARARAEADGVTFAAAQDLVLSEDSGLRVAYDHRFVADR